MVGVGLPLRLFCFQGEEENKLRMLNILKKRPGARDLEALRVAYDDAVDKGFVHGELPKAAAVLAWQASTAEAVLVDQAAVRASGKCSRKASGCPQDSFPLFGGCEVAACVHVPVGEDGRSTMAKTGALERAVPELLKATNLKEANKMIKAMLKQRRKVPTRVEPIL